MAITEEEQIPSNISFFSSDQPKKDEDWKPPTAPINTDVKKNVEWKPPTEPISVSSDITSDKDEPKISNIKTKGELGRKDEGPIGGLDKVTENIHDSISQWIANQASYLPESVRGPAATIATGIAGLPTDIIGGILHGLGSDPTAPALGMAGLAKNALPKIAESIAPEIVNPATHLPPDMAPVGGENAYNAQFPKPQTKTFDQAAYDIASKKKQMGLELPGGVRPNEGPRQLFGGQQHGAAEESNILRNSPYGEGSIMPSASIPTEMRHELTGPQQLSQAMDKHPGFANGDIRKPPMEAVQNALPPKTPLGTVLPPPGNARPHPLTKDISNVRAEFGSVNQTLASRPQTRRIAEIITGQQDKKLMWIRQTSKELAEFSKGLNQQARIIVGKLLDGMSPENVHPDLVKRAEGARQTLDRIFDEIPGGSKKSGENVGHLDDYLTHLKSQSQGFESAIKDIFDYHNVTNLFKRDTLSSKPSGHGIFSEGKAKVSSPYTEERTGKLADLEYDINKIFPAYVESIAKVIHDKPAVNIANELIKRLPDSNLKELATWYVKNYANYDALPGLNKAWNSLANQIARTVSRSLLAFNPGLQALHVARIAGNLWPELGSKYTAIGLSQIAKNPIKAWHEAANLGLLQNEVRPLAFKTPIEKFDSISNFFSIADYLDKAIGYHGFKQMFLDQGMDEHKAIMAAISKTKQVSLTTDPSRAVKAFHGEGIPGAMSKLGLQFKQVPTKIVEQYMTIAANAKENPKAAARLITGVSMLVAAKEGAGLHVFHLGTNIIPTDMWGPFGTAATQVSHDLSKGDWQKAVVDTALWATPGGQSLKRQLKTGPSFLESQKKPIKLKFINP